MPHNIHQELIGLALDNYVLMLEDDFFPSRKTSQRNLPILHLHVCKQNGNGKLIWETHTICNITTTNDQFCPDCFGLIYRSMSPFILCDNNYRLHGFMYLLIGK